MDKFSFVLKMEVMSLITFTEFLVVITYFW